MGKNSRNALKANMKSIMQKVRRLNLYVNELNLSSRLDYDRVERELEQIKKEISLAQDCILKEGVQQKLPI